MNIVLNFCHKDRDLALGLLQHMREVPVCNKHEIVLQTNIHCATGGLHQELLLLATEMFAKAEFRVMDSEDERPWPLAANNAWRDYVYFSRVTNRGPWLWLEPDTTFIPKPDRSCPVCKIEHEYTVSGKPFMGAEVTRPDRRMSGVAVYPGSVVRFTSKLPALTPFPRQKRPAIAWDQYLAVDIVPHAHFTKLIQHVWNVEFGKPETIPTFPTQESLSLIQPEAVLFHRVKDGSLIARLREQCAQTLSNERAIIDSLKRSGQPLDFANEVADRIIPQSSELDELKATIAKLEAELQQRNGGDALCDRTQKHPAVSASAETHDVPKAERNAAPTFKPKARRKKAGRTLSPEHKQKLRDAWKARKAVAA